MKRVWQDCPQSLCPRTCPSLYLCKGEWWFLSWFQCWCLPLWGRDCDTVLSCLLPDFFQSLLQIPIGLLHLHISATAGTAWITDLTIWSRCHTWPCWEWSMQVCNIVFRIPIPLSIVHVITTTFIIRTTLAFPLLIRRWQYIMLKHVWIVLAYPLRFLIFRRISSIFSLETETPVSMFFSSIVF